MRRLTTNVAIALGVALACCSGAQEWRHEVRGFPAEAIEGRPLRFEVAYSAPQSEKLHAELKDARNVVHVSDIQTVSGSGVARFAIPVPPDRFNGQLMLAIWFGEDWRQPRAPILQVGPIPVWTAEQGRRFEADQRAAGRRAAALGLTPAHPAIAVLSGGWGGRSAALSAEYARALRATGRRVVLLGPEDAANRSLLAKNLVAMLVVPDAQTYPGPAVFALTSYLRSGGHLIALGAPAFDRLVRRMPAGAADAGKWLDEWQVSEVLRATPSTAMLVDLSALGDGDWQRSANDLASPSAHSMEDAPGVGRVLHVRIGNLTGWDTVATQLARTGAATDNVVTFRARGAAATNQLSVELTDADGSRWIAVTPLTTNWQRYALPVTQFALWDPDHRTGRGGPGDRLDLTRVRSLAVGLAFTHTNTSGGKHEFWFAEPGVGRAPDLPRYTSPTLDTLSPAYKLYPVRGATRIDASASRSLFACDPPPLPKHLLSTHPRPGGAGYLKARKWRWIPLLQAIGPQGVAGTVATLLCHRNDEYAGGRWASFSAADPAWYRREDVKRYIVALARRMLDPDLLHEGGAEFFGIFPDDTLRLGAVADAGSGAGLSVQIRVAAADGSARKPEIRRLDLRRTPDGLSCDTAWTPGNDACTRYVVTTTLLRRGKPIDRLSHEITVRSPNRPGRPTGWITVKEGQFSLDGRPWYPHGVNYMPSSGIAAEAGHYFEQWLSTESYDPVVIERDLARIQRIGFNMISAFIYVESMRNRNLVDLLNRCDAHGIRVNLSLRPGSPLDLEWPGIGQIIQTNRLADDPTVFAYDLAWEPVWGFRDQRARWDGEWERWLIDRYGSVENAERDWGRPVPRVNGKVAGASDADVLAKGPDPMVAAYRHFLDDLLSRKHLETRQKIRTVDTRHLLSFRMSEGGNPTCGPHLMGYEFGSIARSMDFVSPEGYGRIGDWERVKPGWFEAAYARLTAPGRPMMWAEFGNSIWNRGADVPAPSTGSPEEQLDRRFYRPETIRFTEEYYRFFYEMVLKSGAAGSVCWWYPGGFRYGENSDFGIINPDGTWRGLTQIIAEAARRFAHRPTPAKPDAFLLVDRDAHADGLFGIYAAVGDDFWRLIAEGKTPGLRTDADGSNSADAPRVAVGNLPLTGNNPPKYLDAEFDSLQALDADGRWQDVPFEGATVTVRSGEPVRLRAVAGNIGKAAWLARASTDGAVVLLAQCGDEKATGALPADVPPFGASGMLQAELPAPANGSEIVVQMQALGVSRFGEVRRIRIAVR